MANTKTTNQILFDTIRELKKLSNKTGENVYKAVADKLASSASQRAQVNLLKLEKVANDGETVIIPGKLLGDGIITKKITVIGFKASESAIEKLTKAGGKYIEIREFIKKPTTRPRIIG